MDSTLLSQPGEKDILVLRCSRVKARNTARNVMAMGMRNRYWKRASGAAGSTGTFLWVALIPLSHQTIRAGSTVKLQIRERVTPLASTTPRSAPIFILMKHSIRRLTMVVKALLRMEADAPSTACSIALTGSRPSFLSCR